MKGTGLAVSFFVEEPGPATRPPATAAVDVRGAGPRRRARNGLPFMPQTSHHVLPRRGRYERLSDPAHERRKLTGNEFFSEELKEFTRISRNSMD